MNLTLERAPALSALSRLVGVVPRASKIPILSNVALTATAEGLLVRATDMDMEAVERIPARVSTPGAITVEASKLYDIVRNSDAGADVSLAWGDDDPRMKVKSGRSNFKIGCLSPESFPTFAVDDLGDELALPAKMLASMLRRVAHTCGPADPLTAMSCVYLKADGGKIEAVGMSHAGVSVATSQGPADASLTVMFPPKLAKRVSDWLSDAEGDAAVATNGRLVRIRHGDSQIVSKLFDGDYFDYGRLLMREHEVSARTDRDALASALRRVRVVADPKYSVRLSLSEGSLTLSVRNDDGTGEGVDEIGAEYDGPETSSLLVPGQLTDALAALSGDIVEIGFALTKTGGNRANQVVVRAPADADYVTNLMQPRA